MTAAVVDCLETVEVHVKNDMDRLIGVCGVHCLVESTLEFATIDQSRQGIMRRLIRHLAGQTAELADVMKNDHGTGNAVARTSNRRCRYFDRVLLLAVGADHNRTPPHVDTPSHCQAALDRIAQRTSIGIIDQGKELPHAMPGCVIAVSAGERLGREIHVVDPPVVIGRDYAFRYRLEGILSLSLASRQRNLEALAVADIACNGQYRGIAPKFDRRALCFHP